MYGYEHGGMAWGWPGMILMWLIPVLLIVLVVRLLAGKRASHRAGRGRFSTNAMPPERSNVRITSSELRT